MLYRCVTSPARERGIKGFIQYTGRMASITMLTSPSGKSFITSKYDDNTLDLDDPACFVFKKAVKKYGFERFDVKPLWFDDDECGEEYVTFMEDEMIDSYKPEYNMAVF